MIVLDTHTLIWWIGTPETLSKKARSLIEKESKQGEILVSAISVWEIYLLVKKGRLKLSLDTDIWIKTVEQLPTLRFVSVDTVIAAKSVMLPEPLHRDPADRMIIATAQVHGAPLVTSDAKILAYRHVQSIW